jgi:hypothetical protein
VTAREAIEQAEAAGLSLQRVAGGLKVSGPKSARTALRPILATLACDILRLLAPENRGAEADAVGRAREPCNACGGATWIVCVIADDGARTCLDCLTGRTAFRARGVPV